VDENANDRINGRKGVRTNMSNYYEYLGISQNASSNDIETACDHVYNQARLKATNHDVAVRRKAELTIIQVEEIRQVLLNPVDRAVYDEALGATVGGIIDPGFTDNNTSTGGNYQPFMGVPMGKRSAQDGLNPEICPHCRNPIEEDARHCPKCGFMLKVTCPACSAENNFYSRFCKHCGLNFIEAEELAEKRKEEELALQRRDQMQYQRRREIAVYEQTIESARSQASSKWWIAWFFGLGILSLIMWIVSLTSINSIEKKNIILETDPVYYTMKEAKRKAKTNLIIYGVLTGISLLCALMYLVSIFILSTQS
jgi:curved DNA-binding protein CbpA